MLFCVVQTVLLLTELGPIVKPVHIKYTDSIDTRALLPKHSENNSQQTNKKPKTQTNQKWNEGYCNPCSENSGEW